LFVSQVSLSGIEFSQSLPGIRGSQYKVEGVLLRGLQSVWANERGNRRGRNKTGTQHQSPGPTSALTSSARSQSQSPWKLRRNHLLHLHHCNDSSSQATLELERECLHNEGYFFLSVGREDKDKLEPLTVQALTLEPRSGFHYDPVVVCDFTALYPSLVIAYNLCYTTCAGQISYLSTRTELATKPETTGRIGPLLYSEELSATVMKHHVKSLSTENPRNGDKLQWRNMSSDRAYVVPNGAVIVGESVLKGVLPQVLDEMLKTRAMLKKASKVYRKRGVHSSVLRQLEARQLALKYVANVTYGYTSATFSGRSAMPVIADAIVECARRTLSNAIKLANRWGKEEGGRWYGAEVLYGDTDSVFVRLPKRSVKEAFEFGRIFCKEVTRSNPPPVELKLEKVYGATLLQTKKRYCGMKYESPEQTRAEFEGKGIETIRKDQCALTKKVLQNLLITTFARGIRAGRQYLQRQWTMIYSGCLPVSDFILTGRVRSKYRAAAEKSPPAAAAMSRRLAESDPGRIVRDKERIPYVIVAAPGRNFKLRDCVLSPVELLEQWDAYRINVGYYIVKQLNAAVQRCLGLPPYQADVHSWFEKCPKPRKRIHVWPATRTGTTTMITNYFGADSCALCGAKHRMRGNVKVVVCDACKENALWARFTATQRLGLAQSRAHAIARICSSCNGCPETAATFAPVKGGQGVVTPLANCTCVDCPATFERHKAQESLLIANALCAAVNLA
jgi:DNA polymerase zeta